MNCVDCLSKNVIFDVEKSEFLCDDCGLITAYFNNDNDVQYEEFSNGKVMATGQIISIGKYAVQKATISKAQSRISNLCTKLNLTKSIEMHSLSLFKSLLDKGLTKGINSNLIAGSCVYLSSKINSQPLMLFDVSDKLNVNVYKLGKVLKKVSSVIEKDVPKNDLHIFIQRFAFEFELGTKCIDVIITAKKLLSRMLIDRIGIGKRQTGVIGAALYIAARLHGFDRNYQDIAGIVNLSKEVIEKRVFEWTETSTANLTLSELNAINLDEEASFSVSKNGKSNSNTQVSTELRNAPCTEKTYPDSFWYNFSEEEDAEIERTCIRSKEDAAMWAMWREQQNDLIKKEHKTTTTKKNKKPITTKGDIRAKRSNKKSKVVAVVLPTEVGEESMIFSGSVVEDKESINEILMESENGEEEKPESSEHIQYDYNEDE